MTKSTETVLDPREQFLKDLKKGLPRTVKFVDHGNGNWLIWFTFTKWDSSLVLEYLHYWFEDQKKTAKQIKNIAAYVKHFFEWLKINDKISYEWPKNQGSIESPVDLEQEVGLASTVSQWSVSVTRV